MLFLLPHSVDMLCSWVQPTGQEPEVSQSGWGRVRVPTCQEGQLWGRARLPRPGLLRLRNLQTSSKHDSSLLFVCTGFYLLTLFFDTTIQNYQMMLEMFFPLINI